MTRCSECGELLRVKQNRRGTVVRVGSDPTHWKVRFRHRDCSVAKRFYAVDPSEPERRA